LPHLEPAAQRQFAYDVAVKLREAGFEALWAGGCVRDQLLDRTPKDYDVATNALPDQVRALFGRKRTLAIGASFGVISVLGSPGAGQIDVATFREDTGYSDGRHPDAVRFSSAQFDASRRDFTINGLFFDPIDKRVIDFVGGQADLEAGRIRAIGDPRQRLAEDKLRMLRAIRFAATFDFQIEPDTFAAIREMADQVEVVSPERIAAEMRRLLVEPGRAVGARLLVDSRLADAILPEIAGLATAEPAKFEHRLAVLASLAQPGFPLSLAALLSTVISAEATEAVGRRWRLSNHEIERVVWLVRNHAGLSAAPRRRWSEIQPYLAHGGGSDLVALAEAESLACGENTADWAWCRQQQSQPREALDPPPLATGDDLRGMGIPAGPRYRLLLERLRVAQLDREVQSREEALALARRLADDRENPAPEMQAD